MRQTIMLMAACAALLASCTNEVGEGLGIDTPIQVTASVEGIMTTRAENTKDNLDNFGLYIKDKDGGYDTNYGGENIKVSKPEGESVWTLADEVLYQGSGQTYFAYAPYQSIEAGATSVDFSIEKDQSGSEYMQASDLLYAAGSVTSPELTVNFSHKLCKLTVKLQTEADFLGTISYEHLYLRGCLPTTSLNLTDGTLGEAKGEAIDTEMWHNEESGNYECILVPQTVKYSVVVVAKVNNSPKSYVYTPANAYEFKSNNSYTLTLTIKEQDVQSEINSIKVAGWGDGNDIDLGNVEIGDGYTYDASTNTYTVSSAKGLLAWAKVANQSIRGVNCTLAADIDMTNREWESITYYGTFDGNGHKITGLTNCFTYRNAGTIKNLTFIEPNISSSYYAGAVTGENMGIIENCHVVGGSVKGNINAGGIAGVHSGGTIRACSSSAAVSFNNDVDARIGGIAGLNDAVMTACYATGSVAGEGNDVYVGAIVGENGNYGTITACYWSMDNMERGVGNALMEGATEVADNVTWDTAMNAMNTALTDAGFSYQWIENTGEDKDTRPLVIATE